MTRSGPLEGVRIVDLSRLLPGAFCTLVLADLGADVLKVEQPGEGDYMRWIDPMVGEYSALFSATCRNKRSITVDLKTPDGPSIVRRLADGADVVVESFRPGVAARLGIAYEQLSADDERLIYCSITGYGQDGPKVADAGHDLNYLAAAGIASMTAGPDRRPVLPALQLADVWGGGLTAAAAVLAALLEQRATGRGRFLDVSMTDGVAGGLVNHAANWLGGGVPFRPSEMLLSGGVPNYGMYEASDGWVSVAPTEPKFWDEVCRLLDRPDLVDAHNDAGEAGDRARAELAALFRTRSRAEWASLLGTGETCFEPVLTMEEALESDLFASRRLVTEVKGAHGVERQMVSPLDRLGSGDHVPAPGLGEHTDDVLRAVGYGEDEIGRLHVEGVV